MVEPIQRNGRRGPGFVLGDDPRAERLRTTLGEVMGEIKRFARALTPREEAILRIGLEASHLEESVAHGDWTRAEAHAETIAKLLGGLHG